MATTATGTREAAIREMFDAVDHQEPAKFLTYLTEDASFKFGNMPTARGPQEIGTAFEGFCASIKSLRHEYVEFLDFRDTWVVEQLVHYVDLWDRSHALPCVNVLRFRGDKVADYRIFMDVGPLFTPPAP